MDGVCIYVLLYYCALFGDDLKILVHYLVKAVSGKNNTNLNMYIRIWQVTHELLRINIHGGG